MVEQLPLDAVFHALSDGTRRAMLRQLTTGERTVGDLAAPYPMSLAAASKHIRVLEDAGLVRREIKGRSHICRLEAAPMHAGQEWIRHFERFWTQRLDVLEALLIEDDKGAQNDPE
ncbi:transcriptional regulator [Asticcacaulis sp. AC460]|nr:transcriptional regulator [Asticcacaulis sp. AC460]